MDKRLDAEYGLYLELGWHVRYIIWSKNWDIRAQRWHDLK